MTTAKSAEALLRMMAMGVQMPEDYIGYGLGEPGYVSDYNIKPHYNNLNDGQPRYRTEFVHDPELGLAYQRLVLIDENEPAEDMGAAEGEKGKTFVKSMRK